MEWLVPAFIVILENLERPTFFGDHLPTVLSDHVPDTSSRQHPELTGRQCREDYRSVLGEAHGFERARNRDNIAVSDSADLYELHGCSIYAYIRPVKRGPYGE